MTDTMKTERSRAACAPGRGVHPETFYPLDERPQSAGVARARAVCGRCPVRDACLAWALAHAVEGGVWGGLTGAERDALLATPPGVLRERHAAGAADRELRARVHGRRGARCRECGTRQQVRMSDGLVCRHSRSIERGKREQCPGTYGAPLVERADAIA